MGKSVSVMLEELWVGKRLGVMGHDVHGLGLMLGRHVVAGFEHGTRHAVGFLVGMRMGMLVRMMGRSVTVH